jgi:hypothetical protein
MSGTFEGVGSLQFTPDNKFAQIASGIKDTSGQNNIDTLLEFETNSEYLDSIIYITNGSGSGDDMRYYVRFNGVAMYQIYAGTSDVLNQFGQPWRMIIPPFTTVLITMTNVSSGSARAHTALVYGKVGGAIEQQNLEAITDASNWASE